MQNLHRRGFDLGPIPQPNSSADNTRRAWQQGLPVKLTNVCTKEISQNKSHTVTTESFVLSILEGEAVDELLQKSPYFDRLQQQFESMGAAYNEADEQELETIMFDAINNPSAEDLWMKVSWLSFYDDDASIRFRFSFGVDLEEDVAADSVRQKAAANLATSVFPESVIITQNKALLEKINHVIQIDSPNFVERIVYFNAPNGGAYLHHDLERGHAGVVYAQISGATLWLALPQQVLVQEIVKFLSTQSMPVSLSKNQQRDLKQLITNPSLISEALNSFSHDALISLINETSEFVQHLIGAGHYQILNAGDVILLPQQNQDLCCWHSVFCLGDEIGQALSFAVR